MKKKKNQHHGVCDAERILHNFILEGVVPIEGGDMPLKDICLLHTEFTLHDCNRFSGRLSSSRNKMKKLNKRAAADLLAFERHKANHEPAERSLKGCVQWQGSAAQECLWDVEWMMVHCVAHKSLEFGCKDLCFSLRSKNFLIEVKKFPTK